MNGITNILKELEELTLELDYMYQEGVIFTPENVKTLERIKRMTANIHKDLTNKKIQSITRQVR